ncbi:MAG: hypothetical protein Aurels2KO_55220 [Aureliella sp.]
MGYYMRYIDTESTPLTVDELGDALDSFNTAYSIMDGDLAHDGELYGEIEINHRGTELCDEELGELQDFVEDSEGEHKQRVVDTLKSANSIIAVRVLWQGREPGPTLEKLDPLWNWLLSNRSGLMQADDEGYYDSTGLILSVA